MLLAIGVAGYLSGPSLPDSLQYLVTNKDHIVPGAIVFEAGGAVALLIANVCLFVFWSGAPALYLAVTVLTQLASFFLGPFVTTGWTDFFETSSTMLNGVILGLIYFSPAQELFKRREAFQPATLSSQAVAFTARAKFCGDCGADLGASKFCPQCGTRVQSAVPAANRCNGCGAVFQSPTKFCPDCGTKVGG
jgi:hypothetical protein